MKQYEDSMIAQRETEERIAAATLLTGYIAELLPAVLEGLKMSGFLLDEIKAGSWARKNTATFCELVNLKGLLIFRYLRPFTSLTR